MHVCAGDTCYGRDTYFFSLMLSSHGELFYLTPTKIGFGTKLEVELDEKTHGLQ